MRPALAAVLVLSLVPGMVQAQAASRAYDRYGPAPAARASAQATAAASGPRLNWQGKAAEVFEDRPTPLSSWARRNAANPPAAATPPVQRTQPQAAATSPALPTSIYSPPSPAPAQPAAAVPAVPQNPNGVRNYSVLREYGIEPDPVPAQVRPAGQEITINPTTLTGLRRDDPAQRASNDGRPNQPDGSRPNNPSAGRTERP